MVKRAQRLMISLLIMLLAGSWVFVEAFAAEDEPVVRVGFFAFPGFSNIEADGTLSGYGYEYLLEIQKYTGWKYEFVTRDDRGNKLTYNECIAMLKNGEIDIMGDVRKTDERQANFYFPDYSSGSSFGVLTTAEDNRSITMSKISSLNGIVIGLFSGSSRNEEIKGYLQQNGVAGISYIYFQDIDQLHEALCVDRTIDAAYTSNLRTLDGERIVSRIEPSESYFVMRKDDTRTPELNDALEELKMERPELSYELTEKYYSSVSSVVVLSEEEQAYIDFSGPITVAISPDMMPMEYYDEETHSYQGIVVDILNLVGEETGLTFTYVERQDYNTLNNQMNQREVQVVGSLVDDFKLADILSVQLTNSYCSNPITVVTNRQNEDYQDISKTVALKEGYPVSDYIAEQMGYSNVVYYSSFEYCVEAVNSGEADMTFIPSYSMDRLVNHAYYNNLSTFFFPNSDYEYSFGVSTHASPYLYSILDRAVGSLSRDAINEIIIKNVMLDQESRSIRDVIYENSVLISAAIILFIFAVLIVLYYNMRLRQRTNAVLAESVKEKEIALDIAQKASNAKQKFLAHMSHEMRTPLNGIKGNLDLLEGQSEFASNEYLKNAMVSAKLMISLVNDVLDMSKIESGKMVLHNSYLFLAELCEQLKAIIAPLAAEKQIAFSIQISETNGQAVYLDGGRLTQIMINLLSNAVKYTKFGGTVKCDVITETIGENRVRATFIVEDTGIGMSKEFLKRAFQPFEQEHDVSPGSGSGLGLAITKFLVELMGGAIAIESELGKGTRVEVVLDADVIGEEALKRKLIKPLAAKMDHLKINYSGKKALLVDDHEMNLIIVRQQLENIGFSVDTASDGEEAIKLFLESKIGTYDIVFMDIMMPVKDGITATKEIRAMERADAKTVAIVAMTANAFDEDIHKSLENGMNDHLTKPFDQVQMLEILAQIFPNSDNAS